MLVSTMKKFPLTGLLATVILFLFACDDSLELGLELQARDQLIRTYYTDTASIACHVILADTVYTNRSSYLLVGNMDDPYFGNLEAKSFSKVMRGDTAWNFLDSAKNKPILDSMSIRMRYAYAYGDTITSQIIDVHTVSSTIDSKQNYISTDQISVSSQKIASADIRKAIRHTSIYTYVWLPIEKNFGTQLFQNLQQTSYKNVDVFENYLLGLRISSQQGQGGAVYGFDPSVSVISFFYHHKPTDTSSRVFSLPLVADVLGNVDERSAWFSYLKADFSRSAFLKNLSKTNSIPTERTGNLAHIQAGSGVMTHIEFPYLKNLQKNNQNIQINRAELIIPIADENFVKANQFPPSYLTVYYADEQKRILRNPNGIYARVAAELQPTQALEGNYNSAGNIYNSLDVTSYAQSVIKGKNRGGLILASKSNTFTVNRLLFGDQKGLNPIKLKLYYTVLGQ